MGRPVDGETSLCSLKRLSRSLGIQPPPLEAPYLLEILNISKGFPGVVALADVQLRVRPARCWR
jgi:hypothetical protein